MEIFFGIENATPSKWGNVIADKFPCQPYHTITQTENTIKCEVDNSKLRLKNLIENEKNRIKNENISIVLTDLLDNAIDLLNVQKQISKFFKKEEDPTQESVSLHKKELEKIRENFSLNIVIDPEDSLDVKKLNNILSGIKNIKSKRTEFAIKYIKETINIFSIFKKKLFILNMQNRQGTPEFVEEFTSKMISKEYDPKTNDGRLRLSCEELNGKKQTFAYQIPVPVIIRPENPEAKKMLVLHRTGAGKTVTILKTINNFFYDVRSKFILFPKPNVRDNFYKELMTNPAHWNLFQQYAIERLFNFMYKEGKDNYIDTIKELIIIYKEGVVKDDNDLVYKVYKTTLLPSEISGKVKSAVVDVLAGEKRIWENMFANTGVKENCVTKLVERLDVFGNSLGCITNFPWSPLRALDFKKAGTEQYSSNKPAKDQLKPIVKLPKYMANGDKRDFITPLGIGLENEKAEINHLNDKVLILDEIHVLMSPSETDFLNIEIKNMERLRLKIKQSKNTVVVGFTATPIVDNVKDGVDLLKMIKGNENADVDNYGFVSYMNTAPEAIYPRVDPGEISLGHVTCVELKDSNAKIYKQKKKELQSLLNSSNNKTKEKIITRLQNYVNIDVYCGRVEKQKEFVNQIKSIKDYNTLKDFGEKRCTKLLRIAEEVMKKKEKTLVLIEEKMGMYPLAELIKRMVELCGDTCFPKYCGEDKSGGCFIEMWNNKGPVPKKIKYSKISDKLKEETITGDNGLALNAFNDEKKNLRGEDIMCIIADARAFTESTSFGQVRKLILVNPPTSWATHKQRVGRVLRACIYSKLQHEERNVKILTYIGRIPENETADEIAIKSLAQNMIDIENIMKDTFEKYAIDGKLLGPLIGSVPTPIKDQDVNGCNIYA